MKKSKLTQALEDYNEAHALAMRLGDLLTRTANALKGKPGPLSLHDWSDLPKVAAKMKKDLKKYGRHMNDCISNKGFPECDCGFSDSLKYIRKR